MKISSLTIAIPAYNEESSIESVILDSLKHGLQVSESLQILLVNDGSTDKTPEIMKKMQKKIPQITIYSHSTNKGFSGAIKSCYEHASNDWIFLAPADGQVNMNVLSTFINNSINADVVVGYRTSNPEPFSRKLNSFIFHSLYRLLFGVPLKEISTAILWKKSLLDSIKKTADDRSALIQPEVIYKAWAKKVIFKEVGFPYQMRNGGIPKGGDPKMIFITIKEMVRLYKEINRY